MDSDRLQDSRTRVIELFHQVAASVPAYRAFLCEHGVDPGEIRHVRRAHVRSNPREARNHLRVERPVGRLWQGPTVTADDEGSDPLGLTRS